MRIDVFTIFPQMLEDFSRHSLLGKSIKDKKLTLNIQDIRSGTDSPSNSVDDSPFGGGPGMVLCAEPIFNVIERENPPRPLFMLSPRGRKLNQDYLEKLSSLQGFSLICGRYEGVDERVRTSLVDEEISIGDFILSGGEAAAMVLLEGVCRLQEGVVGNAESIKEESFSEGLLEYPQYSRPADFRGMKVPEVLLSGDHKKIEEWRKAQSLMITLEIRPDLIEARGGLSQSERELIESHKEGKAE